VEGAPIKSVSDSFLFKPTCRATPLLSLLPYMTFIVDPIAQTLTVGPSRSPFKCNSVVLDRCTVACFFDISLEEAGVALGIGKTMMKRIRRWHGVPRWPQTTLVSSGFVDVDLLNVIQVRFF